MTEYRSSCLEIDLNTIRANIKALQKRNLNPFFCPMVKANAYGHGAVSVSQIAVQEDCKFLGVALYEEALELRRAGIRQPQILVFAPLSSVALKLAKAESLTPVISTWGDLEVLRLGGAAIPMHIKINVGMNRLGFPLTEIHKVWTDVQKFNENKVEGLCCHLPCADDLGESTGQTSRQLDQFLEVSKSLKPKWSHALNSAGLLRLSAMRDQRLPHLGSRPGISIYGTGSEELVPAMILKSRVIHCQSINEGDFVSYGAKWRAQRKSVIGVVPVGYADGLARGLSNKIFVKVRNKSVPVVGTICMDYFMIDMTDLNIDHKTAIGEPVTILDNSKKPYDVDTWSELLGTITYEVMTGFSQRLPRFPR